MVDRAVRFARSAARRPPEFQLFADSGESRRDRPPALDTSSFFSQLEAGSRNVEIAIAKTGDALTFLEHEGLAIDPAFTPDLMVLVGVIPVHFSVRTPKGQRIYKEICVNAPAWSLKVSRGNANNRPFTDIDFRLRGIDIIKKAIIAMATHYLDSEEEGRRRNGQPTLRRDRAPDLDLE